MNQRTSNPSLPAKIFRDPGRRARAQRTQGKPTFLTPACASRSLTTSLMTISKICLLLCRRSLLFSTTREAGASPQDIRPYVLRCHLHLSKTKPRIRTPERLDAADNASYISQRAQQAEHILPKHPIQPGRPLTPLPNTRHRTSRLPATQPPLGEFPSRLRASRACKKQDRGPMVLRPTFHYDRGVLKRNMGSVWCGVCVFLAPTHKSPFFFRVANIDGSLRRLKTPIILSPP